MIGANATSFRGWLMPQSIMFDWVSGRWPSLFVVFHRPTFRPNWPAKLRAVQARQLVDGHVLYPRLPGTWILGLVRFSRTEVARFH